jgi:hypothetical protein
MPTVRPGAALRGAAARARLWLGRRPRWQRWSAMGLVAVAVLAVALATFVDEPLRRSMERELNRRLVGYSVTLRGLDFHPLGFSLDLEDLVVVQDANPDPPVLKIPSLSVSVEWKAILFGRLVANVTTDRPTLYFNRAHFQSEVADDVPIEKRGWQEALQAIYPLKIDEVRIDEATITYVDAAPFPPLHLSHVNIRAGNIRNVRSADRTYPSSISVDAVVFGTGRVSIDGTADFLATPHPGVKVETALRGIGLQYFAPLLERHGVSLRAGTLSLAGQVEYAPSVRVLDLASVELTGLRADYVQRAARSPAPRAVGAAAREATEASRDPETFLRVASFKVDGELGYVNSAKTPAYRVFLADTQMEVRNLTNRESEGMAEGTLRGRFMGSGPSLVRARFRPQARGAAFELNLQIENTDMRTMNDLLRAYGKFDVVAGVFSLYSEIRVRDGWIRGYVKPLFRDMDVYDPHQDREKPLLKRVYEGIVGGVSKLLENRPREEVATRADLSGKIENPNANAVQVLGRLIQNAFFQAILPGFDRELRRFRRS